MATAIPAASPPPDSGTTTVVVVGNLLEQISSPIVP
jgi:hypothetical protein